MKSRPEDLAEELESFRKIEDYADQMRDELSGFLLECAGHDMSADSQHDIGVMLRMVVDLEDITDDCFSLIMLLEKARERELVLDKGEMESLGPYTVLVENFLRFVQENIKSRINVEQLATAQQLEDSIDDFGSVLKKKSRKRLQAGANVKSELLFMDIVRHIEKIGDRAYGVSHALQDIRY